jgi:hypothetical protein
MLTRLEKPKEKKWMALGVYLDTDLCGILSEWGHGLTAPRDLVQRLMKEIDTDGCELRKRRRLRRRGYWSLGPNHTWHIHGYMTS